MADNENHFSGRYPWYKRVLKDKYIQDMNTNGELLWIKNTHKYTNYQYDSTEPQKDYADDLITEDAYLALSDIDKNDYDPLWYVDYDDNGTRIYPNTIRFYPNREAAAAAGWATSPSDIAEWAAEMDGIDFFKDDNTFQWVLFCADTQKNRIVDGTQREEINVPRFSFKGASVDTVRYQKSFMKTHFAGVEILDIDTKKATHVLQRNETDVVVGMLDDYCFEDTNMVNFYIRSSSQTRAIQLRHGTFKGVIGLQNLYIHTPKASELYLGVDIIYKETKPHVQDMNRLYLAAEKLHYVTSYKGTHGMPFNFNDMTVLDNKIETFEYYVKEIEAEALDGGFYNPSDSFFLGLGNITVCKTNYPHDDVITSELAPRYEKRNHLCDLIWVIVEDNDITIGDSSNFSNWERNGWQVATSSMYFERRGSGKVNFAGYMRCERLNNILYIYLDQLSDWFDTTKFVVADGITELANPSNKVDKIQLIPCAWDTVNTNLTWKEMQIFNAEILTPVKTTNVSATVNKISITDQVTDGATIASICKTLTSSWSVTTIAIDTLTDMPAECFKGCSMSSVTILNVTTIAERAFQDCAKLSTIKIGNATGVPSKFTNYVCVDTVNHSAFINCSSLQSVYINASESIGAAILRNCVKLTSVYLKSKHPSYGLLDNCKALSEVYWDCSDLQNEPFTSNVDSNYGLMGYGGQDTSNGVTLYLSNQIKKIPQYFLLGYTYHDWPEKLHLPKIANIVFFKITADNKIASPATADKLEVIGKYSFKGVDLSKITWNFKEKTPNLKSLEWSCFDGTQLTLQSSVLQLSDTIESIDEMALNGINISSVTIYNAEGKQVVPERLKHVSPGAFGSPLPTWGYSKEYCSEARPDMFYRVTPDYQNAASSFNKTAYDLGLVHENYDGVVYGKFNYPILLLRINPGHSVETYWQMCVFCPFVFDNGTQADQYDTIPKCFVQVHPTAGSTSSSPLLYSERPCDYDYPIYSINWDSKHKNYSASDTTTWSGQQIKMGLGGNDTASESGIGAMLWYDANYDDPASTIYYYVRNDPFLMSSSLPDQAGYYWNKIQGFSPYSFSHLWFKCDVMGSITSPNVFKFGENARVLEDHAFYHTWFYLQPSGNTDQKFDIDRQEKFDFNKIIHFGPKIFPHIEYYTYWYISGSSGGIASKFGSESPPFNDYYGFCLAGKHLIFSTPICSRWASSFSDHSYDGGIVTLEFADQNVFQSWCFTTDGTQTNALDMSLYTIYKPYIGQNQITAITFGDPYDRNITIGENRHRTWDWVEDDVNNNLVIFNPDINENTILQLTNECLQGFTGLKKLYINLEMFQLPAKSSAFSLYVGDKDGLKLTVYSQNDEVSSGAALFGGMGKNNDDHHLAGVKELILPTWGVGHEAWGHSRYAKVPNIEYFELYDISENNSFEEFPELKANSDQYSLLSLGGSHLHTLIIPFIGKTVDDQCSIYTSLLLNWIWPDTMTEESTLTDLQNHLSLTRLTKIQLNKLRQIPDYCFYNLIALEQLIITQDEEICYERIGKSAFEKCKKLPGLKAPSTLTEIDAAAFKDCIAFASLEYDGSIHQWYQNISFADINSSPFGDTCVVKKDRTFNEEAFCSLQVRDKDGYYNTEANYVCYDEKALYGFPIVSLTFQNEVRPLNATTPVVLEKAGLDTLIQISFLNLANTKYSLAENIFTSEGVAYPSLRKIHLGNQVLRVPDNMFKDIKINSESSNTHGWVVASLTNNVKELGECCFENAYVAIRKTKELTSIIDEPNGVIKDDIYVYDARADMPVPSSAYFEKLSFEKLELSNHAGILLNIPATDSSNYKKQFVNNIYNEAHGVYYYNNGTNNYCTGCLQQSENNVNIPAASLTVVDLHSFEPTRYSIFTIPWILPSNIASNYVLTEMVSLDSWFAKSSANIEIMQLIIKNDNDIYYNPTMINDSAYGREKPSTAVTEEDKSVYAFGKQSVTKKAKIIDCIKIIVPGIKGTISHIQHYPLLAGRTIDYQITMKECPAWLLSDKDTMIINELLLNHFEENALVLKANSLCAPVINTIKLQLSELSSLVSRLTIESNAFMMGGIDTGYKSIVKNDTIHVNCSLQDWVRFVKFDGLLANPIKVSKRFYTNNVLEHKLCPYGVYDDQKNEYQFFINDYSLAGNYLLNELDLVPRKQDGSKMLDFSGTIIIIDALTLTTPVNALLQAPSIIEIYNNTYGLNLGSDTYRALYLKMATADSSLHETNSFGKEENSDE